jgi:hypothetical protein
MVKKTKLEPADDKSGGREKVAKVRQKQLKRIKENVEKSYDFFKDNYKSWHSFKKFICVTTIEEEDAAVLRELGKPEVEFNVLEAYSSRQKGEFSKQEPSITVEPADSANTVDEPTVDVIEGYMRHSERESRENSTAYKVYSDMLDGGFSAMKVYTKYANEMSFDQKIVEERPFDPTLCGFDPLATEPHKGDGDYVFEITPMRKKEFKETYPGVDTSKFTFSSKTENFSWSYLNNSEKIILVCTYTEKKKKRVKIVQLSDENKTVMTAKEYEKFADDFDMQGNIEQTPVITKERMTTVVTMDRYVFVENEVLEFKATDYGELPLVFFDGNSVKYRNTLQGEMRQVTRPYVYHAIGMQRVKDLAGQSMANEIENMIQHKWKVPVEGVPPEYKEAYKDVQHADTLFYNQFKDNNPDMRLDPPQEIPRLPIPPEIIVAFQEADKAIQAMLGTYDAALGIQKQQLSGVAIVEGSTQSNAAAMPFIIGYLAGYQQVAKVKLDLVTKYYKTPRSIPIVTKDGDRKFININANGKPSLDFHPSALNVKVTAGVNFAIQKSRALQQVLSLMKVSPLFDKFINSTPEGLKALLDNIEMRGIDALKESVEKFLEQEMREAQQQASEAAKNDPKIQKIILDKQKLAQKAQDDDKKNQIAIAGLAVSDKNADTGRMKVMGDNNIKMSAQELEKDKLDAENARTRVEFAGKIVDRAAKIADQSHRHAKDRMNAEYAKSQAVSRGTDE